MTIFCPDCGSAIEEGAACECSRRMQEIQAPYRDPPPAPYEGREPRRSEIDSAVALVKSLGSSSLFLAGLIAYTSWILLSGISIIMLSGGSVEDILLTYPMIAQLIPEEILSIASTGFSLMSLLFPTLICSGMWLFFSASRQPDNFSAAGLTLIKVSVIVQYILGLLAISVVSAVLMIIMIAAGMNSYEDIVAIVLIISSVLLLLVMGLIIFYLICLVKTINVPTRILRDGVVSGKIPMFLIAMNYLGVVFGLLGVAVELVVGTVAGKFGILAMSIVSSLCAPVATVLITLCLQKFRRELMELRRKPRHTEESYGNNY